MPPSFVRAVVTDCTQWFQVMPFTIIVSWPAGMLLIVDPPLVAGVWVVGARTSPIGPAGG